MWAALGTRLLVEDGLGLSSKALLLPVVPALPLRKRRRLARLVLCHLVQRVLGALLGGAERPLLLGNVHHLRGGVVGVSVSALLFGARQPYFLQTRWVADELHNMKHQVRTLAAVRVGGAAMR